MRAHPARTTWRGGVTLPVEFTVAEWATRPAELRNRRAFQDPSCDGVTCGHVFKCRAPRSDHCCGRYVGACVGGSDDNRCADCWVRLQASVKRRLLRFIGEAPVRGRREDAIINRFATWGYPKYQGIEDALFELVQAGELEWFGAEESLSEPMRYRIARKRAA